MSILRWSQKARRQAAARDRGLIMDASPRQAAADARRGDQTGRPAPRPGRKGWRVRGGGSAGTVVPAPEWRGTTVQVCGLFPFAAGSGMPLVGAPLGRHLLNACTVCADPISWFIANLINTPSAFVLARPGLGKSSLVRHILTMLDHDGVVPLVMADLKPDYVDLITAMVGDVIRVGREVGSINPLDPGPVLDLLDQMAPDARRAAVAELRARQLAVLGGLIEIVRHEALTARERNILALALRLVVEHDPSRVPLIHDVLDKIREAPSELRHAALDRQNEQRYLEATEHLEEGLMALGEDGPFGSVFCRPTSTPIRLGVPTVFDVSSITDDDVLLQAAAQAVCWSYGSAAVAASRRAADNGIGEPVTYFLVMDELWRILRAGPTMIDLIDAITRLNRQLHLGQVMITHTMADLVMPDQAQTMKAWGFVERSSMVFIGGLADKEMGNLREVFGMSHEEVSMIQSWSAEAQINPLTNRAAAPPGQGRFLLKLGKATGIPFQVQLTAAERAVNDTNKRWAALRHVDPDPAGTGLGA